MIYWFLLCKLLTVSDHFLIGLFNITLEAGTYTIIEKYYR